MAAHLALTVGARLPIGRSCPLTTVALDDGHRHRPGVLVGLESSDRGRGGPIPGPPTQPSPGAASDRGEGRTGTHERDRLGPPVVTTYG
jgi:hypothetical protein